MKDLEKNKSTAEARRDLIKAEIFRTYHIPTARELKEKYGIGETTAYRDLKAIRNEIPDLDLTVLVTSAMEKLQESLKITGPSKLKPKEMIDLLKLQHSPKQKVEIKGEIGYKGRLRIVPPSDDEASE